MKYLGVVLLLLTLAASPRPSIAQNGDVTDCAAISNGLGTTPINPETGNNMRQRKLFSLMRDVDIKLDSVSSLVIQYLDLYHREGSVYVFQVTELSQTIMISLRLAILQLGIH